MNPDRLLTKTLRENPAGGAIARILAAALDGVEPARAVSRHLSRDGERLIAGDRPYNLEEYQRLFLIAAGKAAIPMSLTAAQLLGDRLTAGLVAVPHPPSPEVAQQLAAAHCRTFTAGHPQPTEASVAAAGQVAALLQGTTEGDLVLALLSGGGSALLAQPAPDISLRDLQLLTGQLLGCGATIEEINGLRKHLDLIKGGGLARLAFPATVVALILSDVVGSPLDAIASGPTVADSTTFADAWAVLERYNLCQRVPPSVLARLQAGRRGDLPETPKAGDRLFEGVQNLLVGDNRQAAVAGLEAARREGFHTLLLTTYARGEARALGKLLAAVGREIGATGQPLPPPACLVVGGETTVALCPQPGRGGRNQEVALAAVGELAGLEGAILLALATDGVDGPTDGAGAVVSGQTLARARSLGLDPDDCLRRNDAYPFFASLGDLLLPGPTGTNVNDLAFLFVLGQGEQWEHKPEKIDKTNKPVPNRNCVLTK